MNLIIFMALLGEFKDLPYKYESAKPICDKVYDFIQVEKTSGRDFSWNTCTNDLKCSELEDIADSYLDLCMDGDE